MIEVTSERVKEPSAAIPPSVRNKIIEHVYQFSGIALSGLTCNFVDTRLRRRLRVLRIEDATDYMEHLAICGDEVEHLVNAFTTNETSFFRTRSLWSYIEDTLLPELAARRMARGPMFWSAACSSGEEPYSLAMLCHQSFPDSAVKPRIRATDISTEVLKKAAHGVFAGRSIKRLRMTRGEMLKQHFVGHEDGYQVNAALRKLVSFDQHNLMRTPDAPDTYDLVLLRNVLIYFSQPDQIKIIRNVTSSIRPGGLLAIGESESLAFCDSGLEFVEPFLYRKP